MVINFVFEFFKEAYISKLSVPSQSGKASCNVIGQFILWELSKVLTYNATKASSIGRLSEITFHRSPPLFRVIQVPPEKQGEKGQTVKE